MNLYSFCYLFTRQFDGKVFINKFKAQGETKRPRTVILALFALTKHAVNSRFIWISLNTFGSES